MHILFSSVRSRAASVRSRVASLRSRVASGAVAAAVAASAAQAQPVPVAPAAANGFKTTGVTVIQNATILTITHGTIDKGSILIRDGKIAAVGTNVSVPQG